MTGTRMTAVVSGSIAIGVGLLILIMGAPPTDHRDVDGYYMDEPFMFTGSSYAIVTDDIDILRGVYTPLADDAFVLYVTADPVDLRMQGSGSSALFMGIAATSAVDEYLAGIAYAEITDLTRHDESKEILGVDYTQHEGAGPPNPPGTEMFWEASVEGAGWQTLDWRSESGEWTAVIMNADASSGVTATVAFGAAPSTDIDSIGRIARAVAVVAMIGGLVLLTFGLVRRDQESTRI